MIKPVEMWVKLLSNDGDVKWGDDVIDGFKAPRPVHDEAGNQIGEILELQRREDGLYARSRLDRVGPAVTVGLSLRR